jgi:hypothetical protein
MSQLHPDSVDRPPRRWRPCSQAPQLCLAILQRRDRSIVIRRRLQAVPQVRHCILQREHECFCALVACSEGSLGTAAS